MSGLGGRIVVRRSERDEAVRLTCRSDAAPLVRRSPLQGPGGVVVEIQPPPAGPVVPAARPSLSIVRAAAASPPEAGRAGMLYRDLLPDRWGGRFIASQITIPDGGDLPDWVHYHRIRFQMIFCAAGWVDVLYEDQGPAIRLEAGDCVVQPPEIRHRVLRSSPGLEVVEVGCPAVHDTLADHDLELPTGSLDPDRDFGGQRFVQHVAREARVRPWIQDGLRYRDTGIGEATAGLAGAVVVTSGDASAGASVTLTHDDEFVFDVVLAGSADLRLSGADGGGDGVSVERFERMDAVALPAGVEWSWSDWSDDFELLEVSLPADAVRVA
jgi:uncharacterized protein YjlB